MDYTVKFENKREHFWRVYAKNSSLPCTLLRNRQIYLDESELIEEIFLRQQTLTLLLYNLTLVV